MRAGPARAAGRPLRVLFLVDHARMVGGAERFVTGLAAHLPREQIEPWVCSTRHGMDEAIGALTDAGVPHLSLKRTATWQLHRFLPLLSLLRRKRFDVLHANMFGSNVWGALVGRACRIPVVIAHEHTWSYEGDPLRIWLDRHVIGGLATRFLAVSAADRRRMIEIEGVPPEKVLVMPVPHVPHKEPAHEDIRAELGLDEQAPLVCTAAVMRRQKRLDVLIAAHARLRERVPDAQLVIAGDGPCELELRHQVRQLGLEGSVHMVGVRHDVDAILQTADAGVMSSDFEGMPLFLIECMAAGTPFVATAVGGLAEVIENGRTGLLVPPRDPGALAQALERVLLDRCLAGSLARAAAERAAEFTIDSVAARFAALYAELVAEARRERPRHRVARGNVRGPLLDG